MVKKILYIFIFLVIGQQARAERPEIEANHVRDLYERPYENENIESLTNDDIKNMELNLDDELDKYTKFVEQPIPIIKKRKDPILYRDKKIIKKGALLELDGKYYFSPRAFLAVVSQSPSNYYSKILNHLDEETYNVRNIDLTPINRFIKLTFGPDHKISYPKKILSKKYYDRFPFLFKLDVQSEIFKEGYLDELSSSSSDQSNNEVIPSLAVGLGGAFHLVTNYDFFINFGINTFFHTGTWISGFEKTIYQSWYIGPEVIVRIGSFEGLGIYNVFELSRSLFNNISDTQKTIDVNLRNSSLKFAIELKSLKKTSTWYTGAYYRLIESSLGRETKDEVNKPRYRKNSNAFGLYFGRTFDFYW